MCTAGELLTLSSLSVPKGVTASTLHPPTCARPNSPVLLSVSLTPFVGFSQSFHSDICLLCTPYLSGQ